MQQGENFPAKILRGIENPQAGCCFQIALEENALGKTHSLPRWIIRQANLGDGYR